MLATDIRKRLFELKDDGYRSFQCGLMPTVDPASVIGVRVPDLRRLASDLVKNGDSDGLLSRLPHTYYEENCLHAIIVGGIKDYDRCVRALDEFLPYVDNWAVCDMMTPKIFSKHKKELICEIRRWMSSGCTYSVRFGIRMLMCFYLDEDFSAEYPEMVAAADSGEYYIGMMSAWYFATALAKRYDDVICYIEERRLDHQTHRRTIQKAIDSHRIPNERKSYLKTLRVMG